MHSPLRSAGRVRRRAAFTMTEMLVVMAIVAIMTALAAGSWVGITRRGSRQGAAEDVMRVLRQARVSAVDSGRGAVVRVDTATATLYGISSRVIAAWHLEEFNDTTAQSPGSRNMSAELQDPPPTPSDLLVRGRVGLGVELNTGASNDQYLDCDALPVFDQTDGVRLEAWIRPRGNAHGGVIAKSDGDSGYAMWLEHEGTVGGYEEFSLHGSVWLPDNTFEPPDGDSDPDELNLFGDYGANIGVMRQGTWYHVALEFDGFAARLFVDGVLVDMDSYLADDPDEEDPNDATDEEWRVQPPQLIVAARAQPLLIGRYDDGGTQHDFEGAIDEPRLLSVAGGERVTLPQRVPVHVVSNDNPSSGQAAIYFNAQGFLDLAHHTGPVYVALGDPYQAALLDDPTDSFGTTETQFNVRPQNPFPPLGGFVLVGHERRGYELMRYESASGPTLDLNSTDNRDWPRGTSPTDPQDGDDVYFARVVRVDLAGVVNMVRP